jgi:hypothetical protein
MEEARRVDLRPLLAVAAIVGVALTLWATGAFAAGRSSSGDPSGGAPSAFIQNGGQNQAPNREDCPHHRGGSGGSGGQNAPDGNMNGSGAPTL